MAFVFDGTNRSFDGRLRDLEGEVFGPDGSAYQLNNKIDQLTAIDGGDPASNYDPVTDIDGGSP